MILLLNSIVYNSFTVSCYRIQPTNCAGGSTHTAVFHGESAVSKK
jgi:hypothetical protein